MDGAWALYEAWVKLQIGEIDTAFVYSLRQVVARPGARGADPPARPVHRRARCGPTPISLAALQARALLDAGLATEQDFADVAARSRRDGARQPVRPARRGTATPTSCSAEPYLVAPLRKHDCPPITDGVAVRRARRRTTPPAAACERPAWIRGIDHRIEPMALGLRDLTGLGVDRARRPRNAGVGRRRDRRRRAARAVHLARADPARRARPRRRRRP